MYKKGDKVRFKNIVVVITGFDERKQKWSVKYEHTSGRVSHLYLNSWEFEPVDNDYNRMDKLAEEVRENIKANWTDEPCKVDKVNSPSHYTNGRYEVIDIIEKALTPEEFRGYCKGNNIKYLLRYENKNGEEDLNKAAKYLEFLAKHLNGWEE